MSLYDAIVVGAGPAGSVTAYRLARAGASVLLVDRARFPRDKPCGGGLTMRAVRELPFSVEPVVEQRVDTFELRLRYGSGYVRRSAEPLILMTQRVRLDDFLVRQAVASGTEFRDAARVGRVAFDGDRVVVEIDGEEVRARVFVGADGANGVSARALGLGRDPAYGVALEGNVPYRAMRPERYRGRAVIELATLPGGYAWVFPKGDHANFGVGGWERTGPTLRGHLQELCRRHGVDPNALEQVRGHRLPLRHPDATLARARALVVGDAAGLVDPLSGDGMYEAFVSARLASAATLDVLEGRAATVEPYGPAVVRTLGRLVAASWSAKHAFDRFPRLAFALSRPRFVWPVVESILRGEVTHPEAGRGPGRSAVRAVLWLARVQGSPGPAYRPGAADLV